MTYLSVALVSRWLGLIGAQSRWLALLEAASFGSSGASRGRSMSLASNDTAAGTTVAAVAGATTSAASAARALATAVVEVDERRHLVLGILQHGTVVVLERNARIR
jgi:hypothetical protein